MNTNTSENSIPICVMVERDTDRIGYAYAGPFEDFETAEVWCDHINSKLIQLRSLYYWIPQYASPPDLQMGIADVMLAEAGIGYVRN